MKISELCDAEMEGNFVSAGPDQTTCESELIVLCLLFESYAMASWIRI
jgi:hypothetical protein